MDVMISRYRKKVNLPLFFYLGKRFFFVDLKATLAFEAKLKGGSKVVFRATKTTLLLF